MPASSAGYAPAPAMQTQLEQVYDYANSIDPALGAANPQPSHPPPPMPPPQEEYTTTLLPERNGEKRQPNVPPNHTNLISQSV